MEFNKATIKGAIQSIGEVQHFDSGFYKLDVIIDTGGEYAQQIKCTFLKDKSDLLDKFTEGEIVEVAIDIRGREYKGSVFNDLVAWKINSVQGATATQHPEPEVVADDTFIDPNGDQDDLPF